MVCGVVKENERRGYRRRHKRRRWQREREEWNDIAARISKLSERWWFLPFFCQWHASYNEMPYSRNHECCHNTDINAFFCVSFFKVNWYCSFYCRHIGASMFSEMLDDYIKISYLFYYVHYCNCCGFTATTITTTAITEKKILNKIQTMKLNIIWKECVFLWPFKTKQWCYM